MRVVQSEDIAWQTAGKAGLQMKVVRRDDDEGTFLGLIAFERLVATGVHQHLGTAFSYMLSGGLTDFSGTARQGEVGINFAGSTHDAIAYQPSLMVSRLEGRVVYGPDIAHALHAGAVHRAIDNTFPDMPPDLNIELAGLRPGATWIPGVTRRLVYDYVHTATDRRLVDLTMLPGATVPRHRLGGVVDYYVVAGDLSTGAANRAVTSGGFICADPGDEVSLASRYGAHVLVWAEGPSQMLEGEALADLYGFDASYACARSAKR